MPPPVEDLAAYSSPAEEAMVDDALAVLSSARRKRWRAASQVHRRHRPDELMITAHIFDHGRGCARSSSSRECATGWLERTAGSTL